MKSSTLEYLDGSEAELPPHSPEAEAGALGCVISFENGEAEIALSQLHLDQFYEEKHRQIFRALESLRLDGKRLDVVTLATWLRDKGETENAGGFDYIQRLPDATPSPANFPSFLETLQDRTKRRAVLNDASEISRLARNPAVEPVTLADAMRRMIEAHDIKPSALPAILDAAEFIDAPMQQPEELIAGVLHKGSKLVLGGGSKSFKTWSLLDLALSVSHGKRWISFDTTPGRVLYVNFEIQPWSWQGRVQAVARAKGITIEPGRLSLWNLRGNAADFNLLLPKIRDTVKQDFALIVLDPMYKLYGATDENKASDVARLFNAIEDMTVSTGAAVASGAHFSKGNQSTKESIDRISGSGVFARDPDSLLIFTRHETDDCFSIEATLRNFAPVEPFAVRWTYPLMVPDAQLDPSKLKQSAGRKPTHSPDDLIKLLPPGGLTNKAWIEAADNEGIGRATFFRLKKALEQSERVIQDRVRLQWKPINKGQVSKVS